jgi:hypothetical protein
MHDRAHAGLASQPVVLTDFHISLSPDDVLLGQGIPAGQASPALARTAEAVLDEAHALLAPAAVYAVSPVRALEHEQVHLENGATFSGALVTRALAGATQAGLAVCTIGSALDARMADVYAAGDPVRALALEGAGVAAVRKVANELGVRICDAAKELGLQVGMRANPGQESWPIQQQRVLFNALPADKIGVHLTPSYLMLPRKSVSFVLGLGPEMRADSVPCDFCTKREWCQWRRSGRPRE